MNETEAAHTHPMSRDGQQPNRAGRVGVSAAMGRLLDDGRRFCDVDSGIDAEQVRLGLSG